MKLPFHCPLHNVENMPFTNYFYSFSIRFTVDNTLVSVPIAALNVVENLQIGPTTISI
jgi:hypothetical protein